MMMMIWCRDDDEILMDDIMTAARVVSNCRPDVDRNDYRHFLDNIFKDDYDCNDDEPLLSSHPYSTHPQNWPAAVEIADKWELPTIVSRRFNESAADGISLCGIFPEIRRVWASVNNSIFLWPFDKWLREEKCIEYSSGEQVVCAVALTTPKPRVFSDDIHYILVLATPTQLMLVGVRCDGKVPYAGLSLHPLPDHKIKSDGVAMTCITCSNEGRIFMGGRDGHVYELRYKASSFWQKPCSKVCLDFADVSRFGAVDPAIEMVFDNEREKLYVRTEAMKLHIFRLLGPTEDVVEEGSFVSILVGPSKPSIILSMSPLCTKESFSLHLVVVLSDGRRVYCTIGGRRWYTIRNQRVPKFLKVVAIRPPPLLGCLNDDDDDDVPVKFETSYYSFGTLVLSNTSTSSGDSSLTIVSKDYSTVSSNVRYEGTLVQSSTGALCESVDSFPVNGKILFVADVLPLPDVAMTLGYPYTQESCEFLVKETARLWSRRDLSLQHMLPRRRVVVFSSMSMMELVFNRPVDILRRLLESNSPKSSLEYFFERYGTAEGAAMCLLLAANIADNESRNNDIVVGSIVLDKAAEVYENLGLLNRREDVFSGAYKGLRLCSARLLGPLWSDYRSFFRYCGSTSSLWGKNLVIQYKMSLEAMKVLDNKLRSLEAFLISMKINKRGVYADHSQNSELSDTHIDCATNEVIATECLRKLLVRSSEALFLLQLLSKHDLSRLLQNFDEEFQYELRILPFKNLVSSEKGHMLATRLISALIEIHTEARDEIIGELHKGCPSYFNEKTYKFYLAMDCLRRATACSALAIREDLARQAFNYLYQVPSYDDLQTICRTFENLRFYDAVVLLPLQKAQATPAQREDYYEIIGRALRKLTEGEVLRWDLLSPTKSDFGRPSARNKHLSQLLQVAVQSPDKMFHEYLYRTMIDIGLVDELLEYAAPDLDHFLRHLVSESKNEVNGALSSTQEKYLRILGRYYFNKREHLLAADVLLSLAERRCVHRKDSPSLEERYQCLDEAILQVNHVTDNEKSKFTPKGVYVDDFVRLVEEKRAVARFQMKIETEYILASCYEAQTDTFESQQVTLSREKLNDLSLELKCITQLFIDYVVPLQLWEICEEMLRFANQNCNSNNDIIREVVWRTIIDQSLSRGGITEACEVLKKVGAYFDIYDETLLPLDQLCLHLEKAAMERRGSLDHCGSDDDIPRTLIAVCKGDVQPVLNTYQRLLSDDSNCNTPAFRPQLLHSVLVVLKQWTMLVYAQNFRTSAT